MPVIKPGLKHYLDCLYQHYNTPGYISTDPVCFLHTHEEESNIELLGLLASCLAYGRVSLIKKSIQAVLQTVSLTARFLSDASFYQLHSTFRGFKHRFTTGEEMSSFLFACKKIYEHHGSLFSCFKSHYNPAHTTYVPGLCGFVRELRSYYRIKKYSLLPDPGKNSACKRLHLFLRWMIRKDDVDPGPWSILPGSKLIIPLDTHMHRIGKSLLFTRRNQANLDTALEITEKFRLVNPTDPVKYDFSLTRIGMNGGMIMALPFDPVKPGNHSGCN